MHPFHDLHDFPYMSHGKISHENEESNLEYWNPWIFKQSVWQVSISIGTSQSGLLVLLIFITQNMIDIIKENCIWIIQIWYLIRCVFKQTYGHGTRLCPINAPLWVSVDIFRLDQNDKHHGTFLQKQCTNWGGSVAPEHLVTEWFEVLPSNLAKSRTDETYAVCPIVLKCDRWLGNITAEACVKFQKYTIILTPKLAVLRHEILIWRITT